MTPSRIITMAARYLRGHLRRYAFLLIAVSFGFAIITLLTSLSDGMTSSLTRTARQHYAGDLFILGFDGNNGKFQRVTDLSAVEEAIKEADLQVALSVKRSSPKNGALLHYAGNVSRQKYVFGVDWQVEKSDLQAMDFIAGNVPDESDIEAILISEPIAENLGVQLGDRIILELLTFSGQVNTGTFIVSGIFYDPSIFGYYKTYVNREKLNSMLGLEPDEYSALGLSLPTNTDRNVAATRLYKALSAHLNAVPAIDDKDEFKAAVNEVWDGIRYFVVPLKMYISEVDDLLKAMNITSYVVFIMIVLVILVSVTVTYKLVIYERTREIGTLRALGMPKKTLKLILITEAAFLLILSLMVGLLLSCLFLGGVMLLSFDWIPGFEIFTRGGRLVGILRLKTIGLNALLLLVIIIPSVLLPVFQASRLSLTDALNTD